VRGRDDLQLNSDKMRIRGREQVEESIVHRLCVIRVSTKTATRRRCKAQQMRCKKTWPMGGAVEVKVERATGVLK